MKLADKADMKIGTAADTIHGAQNIANYIGISKITVLRRVAKGLIPGIFRTGNEISLSKSTYHRVIAAKLVA